MATSKEIKEILVTKYGYTRKDFINEDTGKEYTFKKLESMLKNEEKKSNVSAEDDNLLDEFDSEIREVTTKKFNDDDMITVMSGVSGKLYHYSKVGNGIYTFNEFGETQEMPYRELRSIANTSRETLTDGLIIIMNKDVIKDFRLEEAYKHILTPKRAEDLLQLSTDEIIEFLKHSSKDVKITFLNLAKVKYNVGTLDSMSLIKALEEFYNMSLDDNLAKIEE